jgi:hypothetical protein
MLDTFQPSAVFTTTWFIRKRPPERGSTSDNRREQLHRYYPNDQKRQCRDVVVEPMFVHAHEDHSPWKNVRVMNAALKGKQTLNLLLQPCHTWALSNP